VRILEAWSSCTCALTYVTAGGSSRAKAMTASANNNPVPMQRYKANSVPESTKYSPDLPSKSRDSGMCAETEKDPSWAPNNLQTRA
jgi:hypothetical protein